MARPPLNAFPMINTVKFRLTDRELTMLQHLAGSQSLSVVLRQMIHDEYKKKKRG